MHKVYNLKDLDCANCAAKVERAIKKIKGVKECNVNFMLQKMILEADDDVFEEVSQEAFKTIAKVEPECQVLNK